MTRIDGGAAEYRSCIANAREKLNGGNLEAALDYTRAGAWAAWQNPGIWDSSAADDLISSVGYELQQQEMSKSENQFGDRQSVVFIASSLADHGGHSESMRLVIDYLVRNTNVTVEAVLLTNADNSESSFPALRSTLDVLDVDLIELSPTSTYVERVREISSYLTASSANQGILFTDPDDVTALCGIAAIGSSFRSILYNHADHVFWIGGNIVDTVIDARTEGAVLTRAYRNLSSAGVISLTSDIQPQTGLPADFPVCESDNFSISVGTEYKFTRDGGRGYAAAVDSILHENPNLQHILITASDGFRLRELVSEDVTDRFHVSGPYPNLAPIYTSANLLVDSIPFGGSMVRLEAALCETPVLAYVNPNYPFAGNNDLLPPDHEFIEYDGTAFGEDAKQLLGQKSVREATVERQLSYCNSLFEYETVGRRWEQLLTDGLQTRVVDGLRSEQQDFDLPTPVNMGSCSFPEYRGAVAEYAAGESLDTTMLEYDIDGYASFLDLRDGTQKRLLRQIVTKSSSVGLFERLKVFRSAYANGELPSKQKKLAYAALAIGGHPAFPIFQFAEDHFG
ncbi:hypothetical protein HTZ84_00835 [Haloterrigena sp. SYSU A558-1]|uniref:Glycosyltransferase n=1 Tax=Haloterrigena gelatinilytica TaxID=2741724 RepID=A0ABX2L3S6_9EURY|nr:hypothetical protein [Haloterrigena gelatinilytica]NUC70867.1 hypothetical protein [Haloterrigena gelatinilytica]